MSENPEPVAESCLYLQITESQAREIAACNQTAIREVVVECCRFMLDCEWGGLSKYRGDPPSEAVPKRAKKRA